MHLVNRTFDKICLKEIRYAIAENSALARTCVDTNGHKFTNTEIVHGCLYILIYLFVCLVYSFHLGPKLQKYAFKKRSR